MTFLSYEKKLKVILFFFLLSVINANDRLFLEKASILESKILLGEQVKFISGDVILKKGDLTLFCQNGRQYTNIAVLYDDILATQDEQSLTCDTIKFYSKNDILLSIGNSHVWNNEYDIQADSITVYTKLDSGVAVGNVTLIQKGQTIKANRIEYKKNKSQNGVSYNAIGNVIITDSSRIANCGLARYDREKEITSLEENPKIKENNRILSGDKIILKYQNDILKELEIPKNAYAITPVLGLRNSLIDSLQQKDSLKFEDQMKGKKLYSFFKNGYIDSLRIEGMAKSLYHVFEDSIYQGKNDASGDTIAISFLDGELDMINIIGGSKGEYTPDSISNEINKPINYKADKIKYHIAHNESDFQGNVSIKHDFTNLDAGFVNVNWKTNMLDALPVIKGDTINNPIFPVIREKGRDPMTGNEMTYNLKTRKGRITQGKTKADDGYYKGNRIRNESQKVFYIENSKYTTCDKDTAHFHFESKKMKVIQNDIVIARPIILHLGQIPILGVPLGIFPHKGGKRHSGWIMPSYGDNKNRGQYIQGLGFYWAPSEYWDSKFTLGFGDKQGATFKINTQYRVRYKFNGSLNFFNRQYLNNTNDIMDLAENRNASTTLRWTHKQELRNNQTLNANATYSTSGDYNKKYGLTEAERMDQKAISNISYSKRWPKSKNSFSTNFYSNIDLLIDEKTNPQSNYFVAPNRSGVQLNIQNRTFPKFSFRHGQSNLFPTIATKKRWYNTITWNYGLNYNSTNRKYYESIETEPDSFLFEWEKDSDGLLIQKNEEKSGWIHTSSINAPQKLFKYISINPSANFKSVWVNETQEGIWNGSSFDKITQKGFATRTTGSFSMNANTQLYGLFSIPIGSLKALRHVVSPSIGYSWTPDFSKRFFGQDLGYVIMEKDSLNNEVYHDRFSGTMAGNTPRSERKSMTFGLNNIFQAKIKDDDDEKKIDLLSWRMSTSYNFAADSIRLANLRSNIRSKIAKKLNLDLSMTHDFYKYDQEKNRRTGAFNKDINGFIAPRLVNARLSTGFKILGSSWTEDEKKSEYQADKDTSETEEGLNDLSLIDPLKNINNTTNKNQSWSSNISLSYSYTATNPSSPKKTFWANTTTTVNVTPNWRVSYRARFDLIKRNLVSHSFSIYRDLHCWELSLNWTPNGLGQGINFRLNVKSPTLSDLKIEKKGGVYSGAGL